MQMLPTLTKFAVFWGLSTINGKNTVAKNKNRHPIKNRHIKYGYISLASYAPATLLLAPVAALLTFSVVLAQKPFSTTNGS